MKRLFIIISALITSPLWALEVQSFQTEYINLRQVDGQLLGLSADGLPIKIGDALVGGIGVGGAPGGHLDAACAKAGIDALGGK